jgi:hypothetical protein
VLILDMIEVLPLLEKYKYDTWIILPVKCYIDNFVRLWSHIRNVNNGRVEFLDEVRRKGAKLGKRMGFERKKEMCEKYLKEPPRWVLRTIKRELNLFELCGDETVDDLHDQHDMAQAY